MMTRLLKICSTVLRPCLKPASSSASLPQFLSLDLQSAEDNLEHDLAGMTEMADGIDISDIA